MSMSTAPLTEPWVRKGAAGAAAVVAIGLLAGFHSVVASAVDRASERHLSALAPSSDTTARAVRAGAALQAMPDARVAGAAFSPRTVSYRASR